MGIIKILATYIPVLNENNVLKQIKTKNDAKSLQEHERHATSASFLWSDDRPKEFLLCYLLIASNYGCTSLRYQPITNAINRDQGRATLPFRPDGPHAQNGNRLRHALQEA